MAKDKLISYRLSEEEFNRLESLALESESPSQTARRLLLIELEKFVGDRPQIPPDWKKQLMPEIKKLIQEALGNLEISQRL